MRPGKRRPTPGAVTIQRPAGPRPLRDDGKLGAMAGLGAWLGRRPRVPGGQSCGAREPGAEPDAVSNPSATAPRPPHPPKGPNREPAGHRPMVTPLSAERGPQAKANPLVLVLLADDRRGDRGRVENQTVVQVEAGDVAEPCGHRLDVVGHQGRLQVDVPGRASGRKHGQQDAAFSGQSLRGRGKRPRGRAGPPTPTS